MPGPLTIGPAPLDERAEQVMVAVRDGVHLATDVYLPAGTGPWPAVLVRLPYDKAGRYTFMPALAPHFTERGYAFVVQDVRGKFRSQGETMPFVHEVADGYDTLEWLVARSWCNGVVGMWGDSYYGFTQWAALASGHPALRAMVPRVTSADLARGDWPGGSVPALYVADYLAHYWADNAIHEWEPDWRKRPLCEAWDEGLKLVGARSAGLDVLLAAETGRGDGFRPYGSRHPFKQRLLPTLHATGWFDNLAPAAMGDYLALQGRATVTAPQCLVVDSADHENYRLDDVPINAERDHDTNDAALARMIPAYLAPALEFFDVFLAGRHGGPSPAAVRWHLGGGGWRTATAWPPPGARELRFDLAEGARAPGPGAAGRLLPAPTAPSSAGRWVHDPGDLVPSTVRDPFAFLREYPDERVVQGRPDVLTFRSDPLTAGLTLAGAVTACLSVASDGPSLHLFAKLLDVDEQGRAHALCRGQSWVRASRANAVVELNHAGYRLPRGHSLGLQLACSDFPLFLPLPGTAEDPWLAVRTRRNEQRLDTGAGSGSVLRLTVLDGP